MPFMHFGHRSSWTRGLLAGLAVWAGAAAAQDADRPATTGLRISGFGTLGVSEVEAPTTWGFRRELTQPARPGRWRADVDTRLGVQANYSIGTSLELVAQGIAKKRGAFAADSDALEWAYASYRPDAEWTLRAGRVNVDTFLMADYRNVGFGFLSIRPPVEFYARLPTTLDGGDVARSWIVGDAQWRAKLMAGATRIGDVNFSEAGRLNSVLGGMVSREQGGWLLRASIARARIDFKQDDAQRAALAALGQLGALPLPTVAAPAQQLRERLGANGIQALFTEVGLRFEGSDWQGSAEFVRVSAAPLSVERTFYAMLGYRLGEWTPFVGHGRSRNAVAALDPPAWQQVLTPVLGPAAAAEAQGLGTAVAAVLNGGRLVQSSWSCGVRWDFHAQAALKLQWDRVKVARGGGSLWSGADGSAGRARVATAVVDFIF